MYLRKKNKKMSHHEESEQNEIGGPVVFALILAVLVVITISFL
jgi:hypothetical protein